MSDEVRANVSYLEMKKSVIWVANHWDIHLTGLMMHDGRLARFETDEETRMVNVFHLSLLERLQWLVRKRLFEVCVGRHWTYPGRANGVRFRRGGWFKRALFRLYYLPVRRSTRP